MNLKNNRFIKRFQAQSEENPTAAIMVVTGAVTALSWLMRANTERANSKTNRREIARREYMTYHQKKK